MKKLKQYTVVIALELVHPHPWHQEVYAGTQEFALDQPNWCCLIDDFPDQSLSQLHHKIDGIIARANPELTAFSEQNSIPIVNVHFENRHLGLPAVYPDFYQVGRKAAQHLWERGYREFGYLGPKGYAATENEAAGFSNFLEEFGGASCHFFSHTPGQIADRSDAISELGRLNTWLDQFQTPVGFMVESVYRARQVIHLCEVRGWEVPKDVAILCGQNNPSICKMPSPSLSAVEYGWNHVGYQAAERLNQMMNGQSDSGKPSFVSPPGIIARESTDHIAVEDDLLQKALNFIQAHIGRSLNNQIIADSVGTSPRTLQRKFAAHLNCSPTEEVRRIRIASAKKKLVETDQSIKEIAYLTGFGDSRRLHEVFRRMEGISPTEYRKSMSHEDHSEREPLS